MNFLFRVLAKASGRHRVGQGAAQGKAVALQGSAVWKLGVSEKMSLSNLIAETGAKMELNGLCRDFRDRGALVLPPGCGPCPGKHLGLLASGDRMLAATVRNTPGRMGSAEAEIYLASPRTAGASAAAGVLTAHRKG